MPPFIFLERVYLICSRIQKRSNLSSNIDDQIIPDLVGRPRPALLSQKSSISLPLFCANYVENFNQEDEALAQMSYFLQGTLMVFILYYLDTRLTVEEPLPSWMMLYSLTFNASKVYLFVNYPLYRARKDPESSAKRRGEWGFHCGSAEAFSGVFTEDNGDKLRLMGALLQIQNHCTFLLKQLQGWERYDRVLSLISAQSHPQ
jgi:hypothetical protein